MLRERQSDWSARALAAAQALSPLLKAYNFGLSRTEPLYQPTLRHELGKHRCCPATWSEILTLDPRLHFGKEDCPDGGCE